ncbi:trypsin-like peptidase domain-containing protein [Candidatus Pacearchaeota archaeon]|nr:trypsin-like peptidase domain-containing protein [Candidatus Pacearchaeota archaeon]
MNLINKFLRDKKLRSITALEDFVRIARSQEVSLEESEENIHKNLLEFRLNGDHACNGLLITTDGYFLTAGHCAEESENHSYKKYFATLPNNKKSRIKHICAVAKRDDLALGKLSINSKPEAIRYRIEETNDLNHKPIAALSRWDKELVKKYGLVTSSWNLRGVHPGQIYKGEPTNYKNHFLTNLSCIGGDSGGVIVDHERNLMGLVSIVRVICKKDKSEKGDFYTQGAKFGKALELTEFYIKTLKSRLEQI